MIEEWRNAPALAKINKDADMALIRKTMNQPDLALMFQAIGDNPNLPGRQEGVYTDDAGTKYYIDADTGRLAAIESNLAGQPNIPPNAVKSLDELRRIANAFADANSPRLASLLPVLAYDEGCKSDICFFEWRYTSKDWSGTDWAMMPPVLQIGMLTNGEIVTYLDSLDLFQ